MGDTRSDILKKNILWSVLLKCLGVGLSFLLYPLMVHYLNEVEYGVWVTLFTFMNWISFLDFGIGLGLKNRLTEAVSKEDTNLVRTYLTTGLFSICFIGIVLGIVLLGVVSFFHMQDVFNTVKIDEHTLATSVLFSGIFIIATFVLSVVDQLYYAYQKATVPGMVAIVQSVLMLSGAYYLTTTSFHGIIWWVFVFGFAAITSRTFFLGYFFFSHKNLLPRWQWYDSTKLKDITTLGLQFFILQISAIFIYSFSNILITQCLGPEYVRAYDVVFKIFNIITLGASVALTPLWSAYTDAYVKHDYPWIRRILKKILLCTIPITVIVAIIYVNLNLLIRLWLHTDIDLPFLVPESLAIYVIVLYWLSSLNYFLNGIGRIRIQMYCAVFIALLVVCSGWYLMGKIGTAAGMGIAMALSIFLFAAMMSLYAAYEIRSWNV